MGRYKYTDYTGFFAVVVTAAIRIIHSSKVNAFMIYYVLYCHITNIGFSFLKARDKRFCFKDLFEDSWCSRTMTMWWDAICFC